VKEGGDPLDFSLFFFFPQNRLLFSASLLLFLLDDIARLLASPAAFP